MATADSTGRNKGRSFKHQMRCRADGSTCGYAAGARLPRWATAGSVLSLTGEKSSSLGSCGCLDGKPSATCYLNLIFRMANPSPVLKTYSISNTVLEGAILYGLKTVPKIICSHANVHISVCFSATQDLFLTHSVFWKITDEFNLPSLLVYLKLLDIKSPDLYLAHASFSRSTSWLKIIYSVLKIADIFFQIAWQKRRRPQMVEFGSAWATAFRTPSLKELKFYFIVKLGM